MLITCFFVLPDLDRLLSLRRHFGFLNSNENGRKLRMPSRKSRWEECNTGVLACSLVSSKIKSVIRARIALLSPNKKPANWPGSLYSISQYGSVA